MNKTLKTITLGCRLNSYESNKISNFTNYSSEKDILVINTCAVTAEAERQAQHPWAQWTMHATKHLAGRVWR